MQKTYTGILRDVYYAPRRRFSVKGYRIETYDGVAKGVPEYPATILLRQNIFSEIIPEFENVIEETTVVSEVIETDSGEVVPEPEEVVEENHQEVEEQETDEVFVEEEEEEEEDFEEEQNLVEEVQETTEVEEEEVKEEVIDETPEEPYMEFDPVEGNEETSDGLLTKSEVQELYDRLGTWSAVAEDLDISTTTLRKYRDELGL